MRPCRELERAACGACSVEIRAFFFQVTLINDMKINFSELSYLIMLFAFLNSLSVRGF